MNTGRRGFTIVELLIVIVVIAVLASILVVGYGAVQNNAHDASVKADLRKIDDAMKQYALDNEGVFPSTNANLQTLGLKLNTSSYMMTNARNVYLCTNATGTEYAVVSMSRSGKRFVIKSETGITEYTGTVLWDATTTNSSATCADVDADYVPTGGGITGLVGTTWTTWATSSPAITNLITNPSVEVNKTNFFWWSGSGGVTTDSRPSGASPQSGSYIFRLTFNTVPSGPYIAIAHGEGTVGGVGRAPVTVGTTYTASVYGRTSWTGLAHAALVWFDAGGNEMGGAVSGTATSLTANIWGQRTVTGTAPSGAVTVQTRFALNTIPPSIGSTFDVDSYMLVEGSTVYSYRDGSSNAWAWNGTANSSTSTGPIP